MLRFIFPEKRGAVTCKHISRHIYQYKKRFGVKRFGVLLLLVAGCRVFAAELHALSNSHHTLHIVVTPTDGKYSIAMSGSKTIALRAGVGALVDGRWLRAADYPRHTVVSSQVEGYLGEADAWQVTYSGIPGAPDLIYQVKAYQDVPFGEVQVTVHNTTGKTIHISDIRSLDATDGPILDLGGPVDQDRVLSDSFSEDRPSITIRDLSDPPEKYLDSKRHPPAGTEKLHRGVGSQLIYNRQSHESLFIGALTSDRFITLLRLHLASPQGNSARLEAYEVDATGTTELAEENALEFAPAEDRVELRVPVALGACLSSERLLFGLSTDYHRQLETYGQLIRQLRHARVSAPPLMGWWSWTAFYEGLNEGVALTNAQWLAQHLKPLGYNTFLIDEGYAYARGEYATPDATRYPHGMANLIYKIHGLGLTPALWTSPFQVSVRSWVYQHHRDWLLKNANGQPIHGGMAGGRDPLFILDTTNPGAQNYLRMTYSTLVHQWGARFIKLDFMDETAVEGNYFALGTTALEAQRIGLQVIRDTVGEDVYLDKDGSPMLNTVGYVDYGRIATDTGHSFEHTKRVASAIAARYYMDRNFFVNDPDAINVSIAIPEGQTLTRPVSLDDARVSIALAAVAGGMLEIGDNLPPMLKTPARLALIENQDLINMVQLGEASIPLDLMSFDSKDEQPSIFFLKEDDRQSILTVFNWSDKTRDHSIHAEDIGFSGTGQYKITDVLDTKEHPSFHAGTLALLLPPHSVRMLKIVNENAPATAPSMVVDCPSTGKVAETIPFTAHDRNGDPALSYRWDFGDGVIQEGMNVTHAFTEPGDFDVHLTMAGLGGLNSDTHFQVHISPRQPPSFEPLKNQRYQSVN